MIKVELEKVRSRIAHTNKWEPEMLAANDALVRMGTFSDPANQFAGYSYGKWRLEQSRAVVLAVIEAIQTPEEPMVCGHPRWAVEHDDEGTSYCAWCESLGQMRERIIDLIREHASTCGWDSDQVEDLVQEVT